MLDTLSRRLRRTPIASATALIGAVGGALATLPAWAQDAVPSATDAASSTGTAAGTAATTDGALSTAAAVADAAHATLPPDLTPLGMFLAASPVAQGVMVGLAAASVLTWTVALSKGLELSAAKRRAKRALTELERAGSLAQAAEHAGFARGPITDLLRAALAEAHQSQDILATTGAGTAGIKERAASRLERIEAAAGRRMARGTGLLASIGSTAPFVGLFGTVWGIMTAFIGIAKSHTTNLAVVAPGIAEALLATAIGLVVAIPAVVLYNAFARSIGGWKAQLGDASAAILRHLSRDLDRNALPRATATARRGAAE